MEALASNDERILQDKNLRVQLDSIVTLLKQSPFKSGERTLAMRNIQTARHWLGEDLKELGAPYPYPHGNDPTTTKIDPPADVAQS